MKRDLADTEVFTAQVRALQSMPQNVAAHAALLNWGAWSRSGIRKPSLARDHTFDQFNREACDKDGWGDEVSEKAGFREQTEIKPEPPEREPFDKLAGDLLDTRLHGHDFPRDFREVLKVLYVYQKPEYQCPSLAGRITEDEFRYRLEWILGFVKRFC